MLGIKYFIDEVHSCLIHDCNLYAGGGLTTSNSACIPYSQLQSYYQSNSLLSYDWMDLHPNGLELTITNPPPLIVLGDSGKNKNQALRALLNLYQSFCSLLDFSA